MTEREWIVVVTDRSGRVGEIAVCNSLKLARIYSDQYASRAMSDSIIRIFEAKPLEVRNGTITRT